MVLRSRGLFTVIQSPELRRMTRDSFFLTYILLFKRIILILSSTQSLRRLTKLQQKLKILISQKCLFLTRKKSGRGFHKQFDNSKGRFGMSKLVLDRWPIMSVDNLHNTKNMRQPAFPDAFAPSICLFKIKKIAETYFELKVGKNW